MSDIIGTLVVVGIGYVFFILIHALVKLRVFKRFEGEEIKWNY